MSVSYRGRLGADLVAPFQTIDVCETNIGDHDFGTNLENGKHSDFPYMFPDQLM